MPCGAERSETAGGFNGVAEGESLWPPPRSRISEKAWGQLLVRVTSAFTLPVKPNPGCPKAQGTVRSWTCTRTEGDAWPGRSRPHILSEHSAEWSGERHAVGVLVTLRKDGRLSPSLWGPSGMRETTVTIGMVPRDCVLWLCDGRLVAFTPPELPGLGWSKVRT